MRLIQTINSLGTYTVVIDLLMISVLQKLHEESITVDKTRIESDVKVCNTQYSKSNSQFDLIFKY